MRVLRRSVELAGRNQTYDLAERKFAIQGQEYPRDLPSPDSRSTTGKPQTLPFASDNRYFRKRPVITVPDINGNVLVAAVAVHITPSVIPSPARKRPSQKNLEGL
jgi:hypothetical protein